jgi:hypothetical protein
MYTLKQNVCSETQEKSRLIPRAVLSLEVFSLKKRGPADGLTLGRKAECPLFEKFLVRKLRGIGRGF